MYIIIEKLYFELDSRHQHKYQILLFALRVLYLTTLWVLQDNKVLGILFTIKIAIRNVSEQTNANIKTMKKSASITGSDFQMKNIVKE